MKKITTLLLSSVLAVSLLAACGNNKTTQETANNQTTKTETETDKSTKEQPTGEQATDGAAAKTGIVITTSIGKSANAGDEEGVAQVDSTVIAVLVDADGKILDCKIDGAQTKINFSKEGKVTTDLASIIKSKQELGTEYGMAKNSGIGKEWNEQANAFAAFVVGKTIDEVKGIAVNEEGVPTEADLTSSVTIKIGGFISTMENAVASAKELGATNTDKLGLAVNTTIDSSKDATADEEGKAQAYSYYAAITTNADGKISSCVIDSTQGTVNFDMQGTISTDLTAAVQTKQELKDSYGMKAKSGIGKEWYEQADAFASYVTGKTVDEVKGIAVSEEGVSTEEDLVSSVTVKIAPLISIVEKAVANAK